MIEPIFEVSLVNVTSFIDDDAFSLNHIFCEVAVVFVATFHSMLSVPASHSIFKHA